MKDKIAQRERTDALVGGYTARTFNEFVKEKAEQHKITPACVRSIPEVKAEWKQVKAKRDEAKKAERLAKKAETKSQKKALSDAKKAEKKAEKEAKKAQKKTTEEIVKDKTTLKKVAKKSAVDAENIKMVLVEKAHKKSQAEKPPQEPKVKGRPKKYATAEEARRAKIEQTKAINKAKKAQQPPKEKKEKPSKLDPDVSDAELKIYMAKTDKDLDDVLKSIRKASVKYDKLDELNKKSYDHTLQIYTQKRKALLEKRRKEDDEKDAELERKKKEKVTASRAVSQGKAERQRNIQMFKDARVNIKKDRERRMTDLEEGEIYEEPMRIRPATPPPKRPTPQPSATALIPQAVANNRKRLEAVREALHENIRELIISQPQNDNGKYLLHPSYTDRRFGRRPGATNITQEDIEELDVDALARNFVDNDNPYEEVYEPYYLRKLYDPEYDPDEEFEWTLELDNESDMWGKLGRRPLRTEMELAKHYYKIYRTEIWAMGITEPIDIKPLLIQLDKVNRELDIKVGKGYNANDLKEFKNYGKITDHLAQHLNDLKEAVDPKDLRDYLHFTREKARLKSKLVGGLVRMIGGEMSDSDSESDMEGGAGTILGNIGRALKTSWNRPVQSKAERQYLDAVLNYAEPAVLAPLSIVAPPIGKIGEAQRQLMKSKAGV